MSPADVIAADLETLPVVVVGAIVFCVLLLVALLWLLTRDPGVLRTRFGFYVERDRGDPPPVFEGDEDTHVWMPPPDRH
ncbi:MAG TPA: hypothetical protein VH279_07215 [Solirubrobacteraceae bacterium]|nr:hypothetical protein [Solirubrobacteraceae bacterium]